MPLLRASVMSQEPQRGLCGIFTEPHNYLKVEGVAVHTRNPTPTRGTLRQGDVEVKISLGYIVRPYFKTKPNKNTKSLEEKDGH